MKEALDKIGPGKAAANKTCLGSVVLSLKYLFVIIKKSGSYERILSRLRQFFPIYLAQKDIVSKTGTQMMNLRSCFFMRSYLFMTDCMISIEVAHLHPFNIMDRNIFQMKPELELCWTGFYVERKVSSHKRAQGVWMSCYFWLSQLSFVIFLSCSKHIQIQISAEKSNEKLTLQLFQDALMNFAGINFN